MPTVAVWSWMAFATVGAALVTGGVAAVSLTLMAVPTVRETPEEAQVLVRPVWVMEAARTREVLPTTRVRALVAVVMVVSTLNEKLPLAST